MNNKEIRKISKFLSLILRHKPEIIDIQMDEQGWVKTDELLEKLRLHHRGISLEQLKTVVAENNKKRFAFNEDESLIRASQGHSVQLDLGYDAVTPPEFLYHGTATRFLESIRKTGLEKRGRHHVHLSQELSTAKNVGGRHGKVIILNIRSLEMHQKGFDFFVSENGVWLTDHVPVEYIAFPDK